MPLYAWEGRRPEIHEEAFIAPTAVIVGDVRIGARCYVGYGAILRGDYGTILVGDESAVEEGVIVHARPGGRTVIENRVTLGHGAMVHNAVIQEGATVGMRAVVSDFARIGPGALIGEAGLVRSRQEIPGGVVAVGAPVKVIGPVEEKHRLMTHGAKDIYVDLARRGNAGALEELER